MFFKILFIFFISLSFVSISFKHFCALSVSYTHLIRLQYFVNHAKKYSGMQLFVLLWEKYSSNVISTKTRGGLARSVIREGLGLQRGSGGPRPMKIVFREKMTNIYIFTNIKNISHLNIVGNKSSGFIWVRLEVITSQSCLYTAYLVF